MTFEQLDCFLAVVKYMNFSVAAEETCVSQSTLSKQIKALETELGRKLFERSTRHISITKAGTEFFTYASRIMNEYNRMCNAFLKQEKAAAQNLKIVSIPVLDRYSLLDMIRSFKSKRPNTDVEVYENDSEKIINTLINREADMFILRSRHLPEGEYEILPLLRDDLVIITNKNHPLAGKKSISLKEVENEDFVLLGKETGMFNTCLEECGKVGFMPKVNYSDLRVSTLLKMVQVGEGISMLMKQVASGIADVDISIIELEEHPTLDICLVYPKRGSKKICREFADFAKKFYGKMAK
jgi:DNA-binding transcriptional LysR family regulator